MYTVVGPWPPQRNGIADYAAEIARWTNHPLQVLTETASPETHGVATRFGEADTALSRVYHIGNNPDHAFAVGLFLRRPGLAVLHDLSLHHLAECADARLPGFFGAQLRAERPVLAQRLDRLWAHDGLKRRVDHREVRLLRWLEAAPGIVVHSRHAARIVAAELHGPPVHVLPHFAYLPALGWEGLQRARPALRARWLGVEQARAAEMLLLCVPGFPAQHKLVDAVLRGVAALPRPLRERVVVLGQDAWPGSGLREVGYLPVETLSEMLLASDLVMALRYPSFGESSGVFARAVGLGAAVAVTDTAGYSELPDEVCFKLPARPDPDHAIRSLLCAAMEDPGMLQRRREAAHAYAHGPAHPARAAGRLSELALG